MESELFTIGDLARASGLTVSALRFYDRAGVLPPAYVDPETGYRWYSADQVRPARIVAGLRRVSMPLAEICRVLARPGDASAVLEAHLCRLERGVADARRELSRVRTLIELEERRMTTLTVPSAALAAAIDAVRFATSTDPELPALAGVLVEVDQHQVRLVATDRFRLAFATAPAAAGAVPVAVLTVGPDGTLGVETGEPAPGAVRVGVNPEFLLQALTAAGHPQLVLELDGPIAPLVLRPTGPGTETFSMLMPVRIPA